MHNVYKKRKITFKAVPMARGAEVYRHESRIYEAPPFQGIPGARAQASQ